MYAYVLKSVCIPCKIVRLNGYARMGIIYKHDKISIENKEYSKVYQSWHIFIIKHYIKLINSNLSSAFNNTTLGNTKIH